MATTTDILVGIDGTHTNMWDEMPADEYKTRFKHSHVRHILDNARFGSGPLNACYVVGPAGLGSHVNRCFEDALTAIEQHVKSNPGGPIRLHLAGYSRGAAIALDLANELSLPPQGMLADLKRVFTFGKTASVVARISALRRKTAGRLSVPVLALFDPVDMSSDIDGEMVSRHVGVTGLVRRSFAYGSRQGWTNVGDKAEPGAAALRAHKVLAGTHGAMGGMPHGDLPKELARKLLKTLTKNADWDTVELRFRRRPLEVAIIRNALSAPGLFVHPLNGGFLGAAAITAVRLLKDVPGKVAKAAMVQSYRGMLTAYVADEGALAGNVSLGLDMKLGSFNGIDTYFQDFSACTNLIAAYKVRDEAAGKASLNWMKKALGTAYPATA